MRLWPSPLCKKLILGRAVCPSGSRLSRIIRPASHQPTRLYATAALKGDRYFPEADVEELEEYAPGGYHPTVIGDSVRHGRYTIAHKLGFGGYSTIWLARDELLHRHVALKMLTARASGDTNEATIVHTLQQIPTSAHVGRRFIPTILDRFTFDGPNGRHLCLVSEPAGYNVAKSKEDSTDLMFPAESARSVAAQCLMGLSYLHSHGVCHGGMPPSRSTECHFAPSDLYFQDLHMRNILLRNAELRTTSTIELYERFGESQSVPIRRLDGGALEPNAPPHAIFPMTQNMQGHQVHDPQILISDFGTSFLVKQTPSPTLYTPALYCPPEAFFGEPLVAPMAADIWTLGLTLYEVLGERPLFETLARDRDDIIGEMVNTLGPLPERW